MREDVPAAVRCAIDAHRLLPRGSRVVVAVSGGADSVALLHVLSALGPERELVLHVAHLDHGLRRESRADAEFVRQLARHWGLPVTIERQDVSAACARGGWSLEDGARRLRYRFLQDVAAAQSASHVALAHTADDQAETVLLRLVRGTGLLGLSAMPFARRLQAVWLVRPFLEVWRRDILAYLRRQRLGFREDASNEDRRFVRNRIRHELLPLLERSFNPNIKTALTQLADQSFWDYRYLQDAAGRQWKRLAKATPEPSRWRASSRPNGSGEGAGSRRQVAIRLAGFLRQPKALQRQLVRRAIQDLRGELTELEFRHWREMERLFLERPIGTLLDLPGGIRLRREATHVVCELLPATGACDGPAARGILPNEAMMRVSRRERG